jgi:nucleoside-diphosphate-sugar epimerase
MTRIGILGASSQVGASVALFLKDFPGTQVTCLIRSSYSSVFFELFQIEYQRINIDDEADCKEKIGAMDVILDFGYPAGQLHEILTRSKENIGKVLGVMKKGAAYFYMSSIMAYGTPDGEKWIKHYRLPRTSYSYIKRKIEGFTASKGKQSGIRVYNFRLGQVHGFLQSVNGSFRKKLSDTNLALVDGNPGDPVNIIFIYPLCEAIFQCINGKIRPGLYTLVSSPQWTLKDLYDYYLRYYGLTAHIEYKPAAEKKSKKSFLQRGMDLAKPYRPILETYILMRIPAFTTGIKGKFRQSELLRQRDSVLKDLGYIDFNLLGTPPFDLIPGLTTDPEKILAIEKKCEQYYNSVISAKRK